jgi:acyl-CoA synthetase (AMP-forming)/AMP-acid ligase II
MAWRRLASPRRPRLRAIPGALLNRPFPDPPATLPAALRRAAAHFPERGIAILDGRGRSHERRTYPELLRSVERIAGAYAGLGLLPGDRVVVALPTSWGFLEAWLGAAWLGALPVAMAPPAGMGGGGAQVDKVALIAERLGARLVVAAGSLATTLSASGQEALAGRLIDPEALRSAAPLAWGEPSPAEDEVAFLQLTSGSTGLPRAVAISHRSIVHNAFAIDEAIGAPAGGPTRDWADSLVSWLPLHHDMGLVGCLFVAIATGLDLWLLPPTAFLARPKLWLEQLGKHGQAYAHAPNFGFQLCIERLSAEERAALDLSNWRFAMTGAEMIRPETARGFLEAFGPSGFKAEAWRCCYGLAEATLGVSLDVAGRGLRTRTLPAAEAELARLIDPELREIACLGPPMMDTSLRIAGPGGESLKDGEIGELRVAGPGVFAGYYGDPEATAEAIAESAEFGRELRTGDLGFLHQGELYLTGRLKDLLIVRGHNFMPHEIEWLAEAVAGGGGALRSGAFSVAYGAAGEAAVLVIETLEKDAETQQRMAGAIREKVSEGLGLLLAEVRFVRRGQIPKTTSGKVQRRALREAYLRGRLGLEAGDEPQNEA